MSREKRSSRIEIVSQVMQANDRLAEENRRLFAQTGVRVIDVMGSPGAGKTALLEASIRRLKGKKRVGVLAADIATTRDAERIAATGVPVVQITTESFGGACHLEAGTVRQALDRLPLGELDLLFIENVGNLVCPAEFDIGQHQRVVVLSVTEGEDKPLKYPLAFREANLVVVSKMDLLPHLEFDLDALYRNIRQIKPEQKIFKLSAKTGEGLSDWLDWLKAAL